MGRLLIQFAGTNTTKALSETLPKNTIIVDEDLHQLRLHDGTTAGGHIIGGSGGGGVPVGTIIPFAGNSIPEGYLLCDGSAISRTDYATLFAVIGTIYGSGDGNSTFNLPTLISTRFVNSGTVSVYGNGMTLGITNGTQLLGVDYVNSSYRWTLHTGTYGKPIGTGQSGTETNRGSYGITTDSSKSGIVGSLSLSPELMFCIKY